MNLFDLPVTNKAVLAVLFQARFASPETARIDGSEYVLALLFNGWCLDPGCQDPAFHCHIPQPEIIKTFRRATNGE